MRQGILSAQVAQALPHGGTRWRHLISWLASSRTPFSGALNGAGARPGSPAAVHRLADEFEAFYTQHAQRIFSYLWRVTGNEQAASDLTQEVFLRAWNQFAKVRDYDKPDAWLFHVATNRALDELRHQHVVDVVGPTLSAHEGGRTVGDHAPRIAEQAALRAALEGLPPRQRAALILRELYGYSCDEIATMLAVTRGAAKMTLSRARAHLRTLYLKEEAE
jgi:RNA polymerase sigma factor (sigma-70 family)